MEACVALGVRRGSFKINLSKKRAHDQMMLALIG